MFLEEGCPARADVLPRDAHMVECVGVENVEATPTIHQHLRESRPSDDGVDDKREMTQTGDVSWVVLVAKGDGDL